MSVFSDRSIRRHISAKTIIIDPFYDELVQPTSYDLTLGSHFKLFDGEEWGGNIKPLEVWPGQTMPEMVDLTSSKILLKPKQFMLGSTVEKIDLSDRIVARVEGKSSLGRLGLLVHATAGFIDPGFKGNITLELYNLSPHVIGLTCGMKICQICFMSTTTQVERPYGSQGLDSKYQNSEGTIGSRYIERYVDERRAY